MELCEVAFGEYESPDGKNQLSIKENGDQFSGFYEDENESLYHFEVDNNAEIKWDIKPAQYIGVIEEEILKHIKK